LQDMAGGTEVAVLNGNEDRVTSVAFSPDGNRIVTASLDGTVRLWDGGRDFSPAASVLEPSGRIRLARFSPDGRRVLCGGFKDVFLRDADTGETLAHCTRRDFLEFFRWKRLIGGVFAAAPLGPLSFVASSRFHGTPPDKNQFDQLRDAVLGDLIDMQ